MSDRKAIIMTALDFSRLDQDFIREAIFCAFCADSIVKGKHQSETPEIYYHPVNGSLCFWNAEGQLTFVTPDVSVKVVFLDLETTIARKQKALDKINHLVATCPAAFKP